MDAELLIEVTNLSRRYAGLLAVDHISFQLRRGEVLGFLGPNGAGKSTTMQMLTGNLAPSSGRIRIAGHDLLDSPKLAKAAIGYLPEQPPLYRDLRVDEYLDFCAALRGVSRSRRAQGLTQAKERTGLHDMGRRLIGTLSKGYQQRVGIAQAIIHNPAVVILDEPTVGLDPIQIREIRTLVRELGREHGLILSTHILPEVQSTCDRVQIIHQGRLVFRDSIAALAEQTPGTSLVVGLRTPPNDTALLALPGVERVERMSDGRLRLHHESGTGTAEALAERAVVDGWGLYELTPEHRSLEQIFVDLTIADHSLTEATAP